MSATRTLIVIAADGDGLGDAEPLLARDRLVRTLTMPSDAALDAALDDENVVDLLAREEGASAALRLVARSPDRVASLVLDSPPAPENFASLLPQLALPVLVLYGTGDRATSTEHGRGYKALLPNGWFVMVYAAGYDIANDRPEAYADLVGDFLARGARFTISEQSSRINP